MEAIVENKFTIKRMKRININISYCIKGQRVYCKNFFTAAYLWGSGTSTTDLSIKHLKREKDSNFEQTGNMKYYFEIKTLKDRLNKLKIRQRNTQAGIEHLTKMFNEYKKVINNE